MDVFEELAAVAKATRRLRNQIDKCVDALDHLEFLLAERGDRARTPGDVLLERYAESRRSEQGCDAPMSSEGTDHEPNKRA